MVIASKFTLLMVAFYVASINAAGKSDDYAVQEICAVMPRGATILRPNSCSKWVRCSTSADVNDYEEGDCVHGLFYNKDTSRCQYQDEVQCPYTDSEPQNRCAKSTDGTYLADTKTCNGYIYCKAGRELHSTCPGDLVFDPKQASCVYRSEYICPELAETKDISPICRSIGNNVFFANDRECRKYNECVHGVLTGHECDIDMAFDYTIGRCVHVDTVVCHPSAKPPTPENTICGTRNNTHVGYFSDATSCSGYYVCERTNDGTPDPEPKHVQCEQGYFFDADKWSCRDRLNVKCDLDRCEGMGNKYVNIAGDCTAYARCNNGVRVNQGKCPSNYYFDERTQGCTPQNINYAACSA